MPWNARLDYATRLMTMTSIDEIGHEVSELKQVRFYFIDLLSPSGFKITFHINKRRNTFTLRDERESATGSTGSTGLWGTREASRSGEAKSLTPTGWKAEVSRLIGSDRADQVIKQYLEAMAEARVRREARQKPKATIRA